MFEVVVEEDSIENAKLQVTSSQTVASLMLNTRVVSDELHSCLVWCSFYLLRDSWY